MPDHVHILISIPPKYAVSQVIGYMKGKSAIHLAGTYGNESRITWASTFGREGIWYRLSVGMRQ
jgi:REP element-mobilizing transposase RayT